MKINSAKDWFTQSCQTKTEAHTKRISHCHFTSRVWAQGADRYRGTSRNQDMRRGQGAGLGSKWQVKESVKCSPEQVYPFTEKAPSKPRYNILSSTMNSPSGKLIVQQNGFHPTGLGVLRGSLLQYSEQPRIVSLTNPSLSPLPSP